MRSLTMLMLAALTGTLFAAGEPETFHLKHDTSGKLYGPFEFKRNAKVLIGKTSFTLVKKDVKRSARSVHVEPTLQEKLTKTIIPKIQFRQARVRDVVDFLREASEEFCFDKKAKFKGVNIILDPKGGAQYDVRSISFTARNLQLLEAIETICSVAGLDYEVHPNWVMIRPKKPKDE